jgi:DNA-binding Lrp family transcriptional regulator
LRLLFLDPRMSNRAIAGELEVREATVATRLRRLVADRVVAFTAMLDWEMAGYEWWVLARIRVEGRAPREVAGEIGALRGCIGAFVSIGAADVLAYLLVADRADLHRLMDVDLPRIAGIADLSVDVATRTYIPEHARPFASIGTDELWLPRPKLALDGVDVGVIESLLADGRRSSRRIARDLGVSGGTVRARVVRLTQAGLLAVNILAYPLEIDLTGVMADVGVKVRRDSLADVVAGLRQLPNTSMIATTVGTRDIAMGITARSRAELADGALSKVRAMGGVREVQTFEMVEVVRLDPFMWRLGANSR